MAGRTTNTVHARIVYFGVDGAAVPEILRQISTRLRPDHRGELEEVPTRLDPTVVYEVLPIKLGEVGGIDTRIEIVAVPGGAEHAPTRKQLLDRADGVVFVADARRERLADCIERFDELRQALSSYGRALDSIPFVVEVDRADRTDTAASEELVRKLDVDSGDVFESHAASGHGVLQTLSAISKRVVRRLRDGAAPRPAAGSAATARTAPPAPTPAAPRRDPTPIAHPAAANVTPAPPLRAAAPSPQPGVPTPPRAAVPASAAPLDPHEELTGRFETPAAPPRRPAPGLRIISAGEPVVQTDGAVRLPLDLVDEEGRRFQLCLTLALGPGPKQGGR